MNPILKGKLCLLSCRTNSTFHLLWQPHEWGKVLQHTPCKSSPSEWKEQRNRRRIRRPPTAANLEKIDKVAAATENPLEKSRRRLPFFTLITSTAIANLKIKITMISIIAYKQKLQPSGFYINAAINADIAIVSNK